MPKRHLDHAIRGLLAVVAVDRVFLAHPLVHLFGQRTRVDPDAERDQALLGCVDHLGDLFAVGNVARVETQAGHARLDRHQRKRVVVVDVCDHRQGRAFDYLFQSLGGLVVGNRRPHNLATRLFQLVDLAKRRLHVARVRLGHGLHGDGRRAADDDAADVDRDRLPAGDHHQ